MTYYLLTGASGLLGSYLLRDCLLAGHPVAALVRPTETQSARERIDASLTHWEEQTSLVLPRPVVLEGDLCQADLNLTASDLRWVANHCHAVIHSAASLTFFGADRQREPWLTNVEGTRRVLDLCGRCGIRQFHYVSTAYVCGLREGPILETELDLGQPMGNDYERSKLEAEKLVRSAALPQPPTIYRPSIIVGDSQTGYTSAFHGFYAMVKLAHTLASQVALGSTTAKTVFQAFNLEGHERKDYVPVDWVSAVITHLLGRPEHHGRTYHLTAAQPTPLALWGRVIQEAVERYSRWADPLDLTCRDPKWAQEMFVRQTDIYRSYWRDDPQFDRTHTSTAAPQLPCPVLDHDKLLRMAQFAIHTNFGKRWPASRPPDGDVWVHMQSLRAANEIPDAPESSLTLVGLQVDGPGGGQWKLLTHDGRLLGAEDGIGPRCGAVLHLTSHAFRRLVAREMSVAQAVLQGQVVIAGNGVQPSVLEALLQTVVTPEDA